MTGLIDAHTAYARRDGLVFVEVAPWRVMAEGPDPITGSIPGAVRTSVRADFAGTPTDTSGHLPLPARDAVHAGMRAHGVLPDDDIVVHTRRIEELSSAARAWFVLTWAGFTSVRVLDGGLPAWVRAGGPTGAPREPGRSAAVVDAVSPPPTGEGGRRVLDASDVLDIARYGTLLDSRPTTSYNGTEGEPRTGHVPHAIHALSSELVAPDGLLRPVPDLRRWFLSRRAIGAHEVGAYCGGGVSSALLVFVGALLDQQVGLYVDSWSAWGRDPSLPVEQGAHLTRSGAVDVDCA
ncbi:sulfurtransferase [Streptomyces sp. NPDC059894]|uniref:sulfurtransferase n=1 Tax=unclassified Streptomyces TaxID=2593676 RepID=UPI00366311BB